jgi:hypothetical protein
MTVEDLLRRTSSRELTEWQVYLEADGRIQELVKDGTDVSLAYEMVWSPSDEPDDP